ncbi:heme-binding protein [Streptomyces sp. NPDC002599]|uniref:GlcG/HbpS family heme-binding protein n=1 Tax=Streptomyces sp. NPDC002599 TaxID=3154421 RepID=UPI00332DEE4B
MTSLTLDAADEIVAAALKRAQALGKAVSVAVVDAGGFVVSVRRCDGARPLTPDIARAKAYTAAVMQRPGKMLKKWQESQPVFFAQLSQLPGAALPIMATEGSVTIKKGGEIIGGLGIAGGTADEDQRVADEVLESLGYELEFAAWGVAGTASGDHEKPRDTGHAGAPRNAEHAGTARDSEHAGTARSADSADSAENARNAEKTEKGA